MSAPLPPLLYNYLPCAMHRDASFAQAKQRAPLVGSIAVLATLDRLYPGGKREYLKKFEASLNTTVKGGFILPANRKEILDLAAIAYRAAY